MAMMIQTSAVLSLLACLSSPSQAFSPSSISGTRLSIHKLPTIQSHDLTAWQLSAADAKNGDNGDDAEKKKPDAPIIEPLQPFVPAMDPMYKCRGPIGEGEFIVSREGGPTKEELSNENLHRILMLRCTDLEANTVVWKGLGYRFDAEKEEWTNEEVFPKWREKFPSPPDLIGMQRIYSKEVDQPSLKSNQQLVRSVPVDNKQSLKTHLKPLGFTGFKFAELTPNKTRRAQCANWLLYYREELFGYTVEELKERRRLKKEAEEQERLRLEAETGKKADDEWKPPVTEVF